MVSDVKKICANIKTASCSTWRQTTGVVNRARAAGVVSCCKQTAMLGTCCAQLSSVALTTPKSNRRRAGFLQCEINNAAAVEILVLFLHSSFIKVHL